jgi:UDP-N-acetylglucosamine 2-epimerase (non-hydrolysing)
MRILSVLGGRPHLVKAESIHRAFVGVPDVDHLTVECWIGALSDYPNHGDHDFAVPAPHAEVTGPTREAVTPRLDRLFADLRPDVALLYGDLPVTLIGAFLAARRKTPTVHIESGFRSGDLSDTEEWTRVMVDHLCTRRVVFSATMRRNLVAEGIPPATISEYGNPALHTLDRKLRELMDPGDEVEPATGPGLITFHHSENVCHYERAAQLTTQICRVADRYPLTVVLYDRTRARLAQLDLLKRLDHPAITLCRTLPYDRYVRVLLAARFVITDSSGLQDECRFLQKPCLVLRNATPRVEVLGKLVRLATADLAGSVAAFLAEVADPDLSQGRDLARLGRPYDRSFVELVRSIA